MIKRGYLFRNFVVVSVALVLLLLLGQSAVQAQPISTFSDVSIEDPNYIYINYLNQRKIIQGFPDGTYKPKANLTRAQAAVVIAKAANLQVETVENDLSRDVAANYWAAPYIAAVTKAGYMQGFPDGTFQPEVNLTRAQGVSMIMRLSSQSERSPLPSLKDISPDHWAAYDMATAMEMGMIGTSQDKNEIFPESPMSRVILARALSILLTQDPILNQTNLVAQIKDVTGEVSLNRNGIIQPLAKGIQLYPGDIITTENKSKTTIVYPDGSSNLLDANSQLIIKESKGRNYIEKDGSHGIAIEYLHMEMQRGSMLGALATDYTELVTVASNTNQRVLLASLDNNLGQLMAQKSKLPWYKKAQTKKVKIEVDMPWGVAAIRGTFYKVTVKQDGECQVACLTGEASLTSYSGSVTSLSANQSSSIKASSDAPTAATTLSQEDRNTFEQEQEWVIDTALNIDMNQAAPQVEIIIEIDDNDGNVKIQKTSEIIDTALGTIITSLSNAGVALNNQTIQNIKEQLQELQKETTNPYKNKDIISQVVQAGPSISSDDKENIGNNGKNNNYTSDSSPGTSGNNSSGSGSGSGNTGDTGNNDMEDKDKEIVGFDISATLDGGFAGEAIYSDAAAVQSHLHMKYPNINAQVSGGGIVVVPVIGWIDNNKYSPEVAGTYKFTALLGTIPAGYKNSGNYSAVVKLVLTEESAPDDYEYEIIDGKVTITAYSGPGGDISIPNTIAGMPVTSIGKEAFYLRKDLTRVNIPEGVTSIGDWAFASCANLTDVNIPYGVLNIGDYAFEYCGKLVNVSIPGSVTSIGIRAFAVCSDLVSITIPDSVTYIGDEAFYCCFDLVDITLSNSLTEIKEGLLNSTSLSSVTIPEGVTSIGGWAFYNCKNLTEIIIPNSVTSFGDSTFRSCKKLEIINLPDSIITIETGAFAFCDNLTRIVIPNSVTSIGPSAFQGCKSLKKVTFLNPETSIVDSEFTISATATIFGYEGSTAQSYAIKYGRAFVALDGEPAISEDGFIFDPNTGTITGYEGQGGDIIIPSVINGISVEKIGESAFSDCSSLISVIIPGGVTSIGKAAFAECLSFESVEILNDEIEIGEGVFIGCSSSFVIKGHADSSALVYAEQNKIKFELLP